MNHIKIALLLDFPDENAYTSDLAVFSGGIAVHAKPGSSGPLAGTIIWKTFSLHTELLLSYGCPALSGSVNEVCVVADIYRAWNSIFFCTMSVS